MGSDIQLNKARSLVQSGLDAYRQGQEDAAFSLIAQAVAYDCEYAEAFYLLGRFHLRRGDPSSASVMFRRAVELDLSFYTRLRNDGLGSFTEFASGKVVEVQPNDSPAEGLQEEQGRKSATFWPDTLKISSVNQLTPIIESMVGVGGDRFLQKNTKAMTLGSCFAVNVGRALTTAGIDVFNTLIPEDVNSTFANRYLLEWLNQGSETKFTKYFDALYGESVRQQLRDALVNAGLLVITVGVSPCLFHVETGEFAFTSRKNDKVGFSFLPGDYHLRTTSVYENVENIDFIITTIKAINPKARIVISVSPVPLSGTTEMPDIVVADCISKSTMRVAVHEIVKIHPGVIYWPSFEIVRWLGAHAEFPMFGMDDGMSRHVGNAVVNQIIQAFIKKYGDDSLNGDARHAVT